jgi:hypothetical protein
MKNEGHRGIHTSSQDALISEKERQPYFFTAGQVSPFALLQEDQ